MNVWRASDGQCLHRVNLSSGPLYAVAMSPDGRGVAVAGQSGDITILDPETGAVVRKLGSLDGAILTLSWSPDGRQLASGSAAGSVRIWDVATGRELLRLSGHGDAVNQACFAPSGRRLLTVSESGLAVIWDAASGESLHAHRLPAGAIGATLTPSGTTLVAGTTAGSWIRLELPPKAR